MSPVGDARELLRTGRIAEAERVYEQVLDQSPDNIEALNVVAIGRVARAEQAVRDATAGTRRKSIPLMR